MSNPFISFAIKAVVLLTLAFAIHLVVLNILKLPLLENRIVLSYIVNLVLVIAIFRNSLSFKGKIQKPIRVSVFSRESFKICCFFHSILPIL